MPASGSLIRQLLLGVGLSPDNAGAMSDRIVDWRSSTGLGSLNGATDAITRPLASTIRPGTGRFRPSMSSGWCSG